MATNLTITEPPLMFGVYVTTISSSVGWGSQSSTLQLGLVEDPDHEKQSKDSSGNLLYRDSVGNATTTETDIPIMEPDPLLIKHSLDGGTTFVDGFPKVGTACQFVFKKFKFAGIFQRWSRKQGIGGFTYDVVFESPSKILDGVQVILDSFEGTTYQYEKPFLTGVSAANFTSQIHNVLNPFGVLENYAFGGQFGAADVNSAGFPARKALSLIEEITQSKHTYLEPDIDPEDVTALGGSSGTSFWEPVEYPDPEALVDDDGNEIIGGPIDYGETKYTFDFGNLKDVVPEFFRIKGPIQNLNSIIQECCDIILHDFIISIEPVKTTVLVGYEEDDRIWMPGGPPRVPIYEDVYYNGPIKVEYDDDSRSDQYGSVIGPTIKVTIVDKSEAPEPGIVESLVESYKTSNKLVSADNGQELAGATTQKLVLGGPANRHWETPMNYLIPVWGRDRLGNFSLGTGYDMESEVITFLDDGNIYLANVLEVRCAASGRECWELYMNLIKPFVNYPNNFSSIGLSNRGLQGVRNGNIPPNMILNTAGAVAANMAQQRGGANIINQNNRERLFTAMQDVAQNFWGRQFMVMLPVEPGGIDNNIKFTSEDLQSITAWDMADSAWNEEFQAKDITAYDNDGKMRNIAAYFITPQRDFGNLGQNRFDYITRDGYRTIGTTDVEVDNEIYWMSNEGFEDEDNPFDDVTAMAHITIPQVVTFDSLYTEDDAFTRMILACFQNLQQFGGQDAQQQMLFAGARGECAGQGSPAWFAGGPTGHPVTGGSYFSYGFNAAYTRLYPKAVRPWSVSLAQESNRYTWGPWYLFSQKNGKAEVSLESTLVPSTFGSVAKMNQAGYALAYAGTANLYASESGYVEIAEFPEWNIAERFAGSGPYITNVDVSINTGGCKTNYKFNTWTRDFGKIAKYNIDRISRINKNAIRFMQDQRNRFGNLPTMAGGQLPLFPLANRRQNILQKPNNVIGGIFGNFIPLGANNLGAADANANHLWCNVQGMGINEALASTGISYDGNFGCSQEQLWSPIAIDKFLQDEVREGPNIPAGVDLPGFTVAKESKDNGGGAFGLKHAGPTNRDLDPYFNFDTNDFEVVLHNFSPELQYLDINTKKDNSTSNPTGFKFLDNKVHQVRTFGVRGPLLLSGWGYDVCDLPVPSKGDGARYTAADNVTPAWAGKFKFDPAIPNWNRSNWKSGPVHLMWDEERKVWAGGLQIVEGIISSNITKPADPENPTQFTAKIRRQIKDGNGVNSDWKDLSETITILNRDPTLELDLANASTDLYVMAIRINYEWRPLWVSCDPSTLAGNTGTKAATTTTASSDSLAD